MSFSSVLDASLPHLYIDPRKHSDNEMSLHTYTTYVKHILGHTSHILALFVRMPRKRLLLLDLTGPPILYILVHLTLPKSQCIHSVWSKTGTQFEDEN